MKKDKGPKITPRAMKVLKAYERGEYHNKRLIEKFFVDTALTYLKPGKCLKLTGFDYTHYMTKLFPRISTDVCVVEREPYIFHNIYKQASKCPYNNNGHVQLIQADAKDVKIDNCIYVDLDIMNKLGVVLPVVKHHITSQRETIKGVKAISFTASIRKGGKADERFDLIQDFLHSEFDADLLGFNGESLGFGKGGDSFTFPGSIKGRQGVYVKQKTPNFIDMGDILNFQFFHYSDSAPYLSALIVYQ